MVLLFILLLSLNRDLKKFFFSSLRLFIQPISLTGKINPEFDHLSLPPFLPLWSKSPWCPPRITQKASWLVPSSYNSDRTICFPHSSLSYPFRVEVRQCESSAPKSAWLLLTFKNQSPWPPRQSFSPCTKCHPLCPPYHSSNMQSVLSAWVPPLPMAICMAHFFIPWLPLLQ